jgi:ribosome-associated heat shock protein Hsp15
MKHMSDQPGRVRIDKWLWAARFFKTRGNAAEAVAGGKVHVNGQRVKPARAVGPGDELKIRRDDFEFMVTIVGATERRGTATAARLLYEESAESVERRERVAEEKRLRRELRTGPDRRPDKKGRRELLRAKKGGL